jgi:hypothetical protein
MNGEDEEAIGYIRSHDGDVMSVYDNHRSRHLKLPHKLIFDDEMKTVGNSDLLILKDLEKYRSEND